MQSSSTLSNSRRHRPRRRLRTTSGFSLLEILTVIGLMVLLGTFMVVAFSDIGQSASINIAETFVKNTLDAPLLKYKMDMGSYPSSEQGLSALIAAPSSAPGKWRGPYLRESPIDPWNNPYQYRYPGTHNPNGYDVWSWGPNGTEGGGDDIGNWKTAGQ